MDCQVCLETYGDGEHRPRTLWCGHSFCTRCIANVMKVETVQCPTCRTSHRAMAVTAFPVSFMIEDLISQLKAGNLESAPVAKPRHSLASNGGFAQTLKTLVKEQEESMTSMDTLCQAMEKQLEMYNAHLEQWVQDHIKLHDDLVNLQKTNDQTLDQLRNEKLRIFVLRQELEERRAQRQSMRASILVVSGTQEIVKVIDEAERSNIEMREWNDKCQKVLPDVNAIHQSHKVRKVTKRALRQVEDEMFGEDLFAPNLPQTHDYTIEDKVNWITKSNRTQINIRDIRSLQKPVKTLLEFGRLVAVDARHRSAKLTYTDDQLHLHTLLDQPTTTHNNIVQHGAVMALLDPSSTLVFLDLSWEGLHRGRVYISLFPNTVRTKQFLLLCTGQRGPSHRNTSFLYVGEMGRQFEYVMGGDYEMNTGEGGAPLLLRGQKDGPECNRPNVAGVVFACHELDSAKSAQFFIRTGNGGSTKYTPVFGKVDRGLEVVRAAVNHINIQDVIIADCGVVVPL